MVDMAQDSEAPESVAVKGFGVELQAKGQAMVLTVIALAVVGSIIYLGYVHHTATVEDDNKILDKLNEMVFVLALPQDKREKLEIDMPDSLRAKINRQRRRKAQEDNIE